MHIELWQVADERWHWNIVSSRIVADAESFPTKQHALRAAKAVIRQIIKSISNAGFQPDPPRFILTAIGENASN